LSGNYIHDFESLKGGWAVLGKFSAHAHWLAFFGVVLAGWGALFAMAVPGDIRALEAIYGSEFLAAICGTTPGSAGPVAAVTMWALMSGAMMAPTAVPAFRTFDQLPGATGFWRLVAGFLFVWLGFSVLAGLTQVALYRSGLIGASGASVSIALTAALLIGAGAYQFSALKEACLSRCRAPLTFFMAHWDEGPWRNGLRLGADCLGCCWALMALAFVGGTMNLGFMGLALVLMTLEKLPDLGQWITRPLGVALIGLGLVSPFISIF
jgi:predicted metal-binding membrane protein